MKGAGGLNQSVMVVGMPRCWVLGCCGDGIVNVGVRWGGRPGCCLIWGWEKSGVPNFNSGSGTGSGLVWRDIGTRLARRIVGVGVGLADRIPEDMGERWLLGFAEGGASDSGGVGRAWA